MNFDNELLKIIETTKKEGKKSLLLQACCAPCSSYVLEYISKYFDITILYYNPNISPYSEYEKRLNELKGLLEKAPFAKDVKIMPCDYDNDKFELMAKGLEELKEGGARCKKCYELRLRKTAEIAKLNNFDYFGTTLSISPYKNAIWLNEIGRDLEKELGINYLYSDFKKKNGYKRSIELSNEYKLYRQDYCGCVYSKNEKERREK